MQGAVSALVVLAARARAQEPVDDAIVAALGCRPGFLWGSASAASQAPGGTLDADVRRARELGIVSLRYSVAWPEVFSRGQDGSQQAVPQGVEAFKHRTSAVLTAGLAPLVAMMPWDAAAEVDWRSSDSVEAFAEYADFLFLSFPEVNHWITFDDPLSLCTPRSASAAWPVRERYRCGHNVLRAHARAVAAFRERYGKAEGRHIGISLRYDFVSAADPSSAADRAAAQLSHDFSLGWWADPIFLSGDYPESMKRRLGEDLPNFTGAERLALKGSWKGFYGMSSHSGSCTSGGGCLLELEVVDDGAAGLTSLHPVQRRVQEHLQYVDARYGPSSIIITQSGCAALASVAEGALPASDNISRLGCYRSYLAGVATAVSASSVPVMGFYTGALLDAVEQPRGPPLPGNASGLQRRGDPVASWYAALLRRLEAGDHAPFGCLEAGRIALPTWVTLLLALVPVLLCTAVILATWHERSSRHGEKLPTRRAAPSPAAALIARADSSTVPDILSAGLSLWSQGAPSLLHRAHVQVEGSPADPGQADAKEAVCGPPREVPEPRTAAPPRLAGPTRQASRASSSSIAISSQTSWIAPHCFSTSYSLPEGVLPYRPQPPLYRLMVRAAPAAPRVTSIIWRRQSSAAPPEAETSPSYRAQQATPAQSVSVPVA